MLDAQEKARFSWHCRRGMLELDLILQRFLQNGIDQLNEQKKLSLLIYCLSILILSYLPG